MEQAIRHDQQNSNRTNENITNPDQFQIYQSPTNREMHEADTSMDEAFFAPMFPLGPTMYNTSAISNSQYQNGPDHHNNDEQRIISSGLDYHLSNNHQLSLDHMRRRMDNDRDFRTPISNTNQVGIHYDGMVQYDPRVPLLSPPSISQAHDMTQLNDHAYSQQYYWNQVPNYFPRDPTSMMIPDPFEIQQPQPIIPSNKKTIACPQVTNPQQIPSIPAHYMEPNQPCDTTRSKRLKSSREEPSTHQTCPSADTSFSSSTDESSLNELHIIETSMSSCELLEPPSCPSSSPPHAKHSSTSTEVLPLPLGPSTNFFCNINQTYSPTQEPLPIIDTHKKRSRSGTNEKSFSAPSTILIHQQIPSSYATCPSTTAVPLDEIAPGLNISQVSGSTVEQAQDERSVTTLTKPLAPKTCTSVEPTHFDETTKPDPSQNLTPIKQSKNQTRLKRRKKVRGPTLSSSDNQPQHKRDRSNSITNQETPPSKQEMISPESLERKQSIQKALEALDTLTDYLSKDVSGNNDRSSFATPQHFFVLGELGGRLRRRLDWERE
ncbi:uncharacterized protein MELLADRAFT_59860 [Melampsora larici-populina 98AG31]|uniref:Uncharacterized protein n=1 Tax=Melampsora larici-populina (strain 98AG31 / pathotype 3-4-7) TaxID=747676 RepID=F4R923_MELLP|nr:uncharacterized protein MELLADRAFT_59860 [Melampsora larici-populina 98AG31]EGG11231.1 hypothetical protein MELLADRAFT_59860 [Melampsora larici-populina 98AG31]